MTDVILVINAGSSSIKFALYSNTLELPQVQMQGKISKIGQQPTFFVADAQGADLSTQANFVFDHTAQHQDLIKFLLDWLHHSENGFTIVGVGHRVVHGGGEFLQATKVDKHIIEQLRKLTSLAPLHQAHNVAAIDAVTDWEPSLEQVACFDTSFHHTQAPLARLFALPRIYSEQGVIRYGFHGLSYEYIASQLPEYLAGLADGRVIVAHLGNGASMCAMKERKSVATSMGFTALDGLMMGQRCGALDPGVILHLMQYYKMSVEEVEHMLYHESGLLGVSGISNDMQSLQNNPHPHAQQAIDLFCYRAAQTLASLVSTINGIDAIVFTGGIGENSALVRQRICDQLIWLGVEIDATANQQNRSNISTNHSYVRTIIIPTNEELIIANDTTRLLSISPN